MINRIAFVVLALCSFAASAELTISNNMPWSSADVSANAGGAGGGSEPSTPWEPPAGEGALDPTNNITVTCVGMAEGETFTLPETGITYTVVYTLVS